MRWTFSATLVHLFSFRNPRFVALGAKIQEMRFRSEFVGMHRPGQVGAGKAFRAGKQLQTCDVGERIVNRFVEARVPLDRGQIDFGARAIRCCIKHLSLDTGPSCN